MGVVFGLDHTCSFKLIAFIMLTDFALHAQLGSVKVHRSLFRYHLAEGEQCKLRGNHAKESSDSRAAHDSPA